MKVEESRVRHFLITEWYLINLRLYVIKGDLLEAQRACREFDNLVRRYSEEAMTPLEIELVVTSVFVSTFGNIREMQ